MKIMQIKSEYSGGWIMFFMLICRSIAFPYIFWRLTRHLSGSSLRFGSICFADHFVTFTPCESLLINVCIWLRCIGLAFGFICVQLCLPFETKEYRVNIFFSIFLYNTSRIVFFFSILWHCIQPSRPMLCFYITALCGEQRGKGQLLCDVVKP